jgi:hypothetical protein
MVLSVAAKVLKAAATAAFVVATATATAVAITTANAALSFDQVQDLLGTPDKTTAASGALGGANNGGRPTF